METISYYILDSFNRGSLFVRGETMGKGIVIPFKKKIEKEELSEKDIKEIMGMDRDVYIKRDGVVKRKG